MDQPRRRHGHEQGRGRGVCWVYAHGGGEQEEGPIARVTCVLRGRLSCGARAWGRCARLDRAIYVFSFYHSEGRYIRATIYHTLALTAIHPDRRGHRSPSSDSRPDASSSLSLTEPADPAVHATRLQRADAARTRRSSACRRQSTSSRLAWLLAAFTHRDTLLAGRRYTTSRHSGA